MHSGRETAGPGSVGAREAVRMKRIGSTLAITGTRSRSSRERKGRGASILSGNSSSAGKPFVGFLSVCSAVPSLEAAASLGERGLPRRRNVASPCGRNWIRPTARSRIQIRYLRRRGGPGDYRGRRRRLRPAPRWPAMRAFPESVPRISRPSAGLTRRAPVPSRAGARPSPVFLPSPTDELRADRHDASIRRTSPAPR